MTDKPKKELGQHWLHEVEVLDKIVDYAGVELNDTVLEIGPGLGTLTTRLLKKRANVVAVEFDQNLASKLRSSLTKSLNSEQVGNLSVVQSDILKFDFTKLPKNYKVVANIPYYLTSHLIRVLGEANNPPSIAVLLVQKEVAERICASPGKMSLLSISAQVFFDVGLGLVVSAELFTPPPKVDSQVVVMKRYAKNLVSQKDQKEFFRLVKAGFSERRKKLRSSLSGGLRISKEEADELLTLAKIDSDLRAQALSLDDWQRLLKTYQLTTAKH